jgi:hypothetical protein
VGEHSRLSVFGTKSILFSTSITTASAFHDFDRGGDDPKKRNKISTFPNPHPNLNPLPRPRPPFLLLFVYCNQISTFPNPNPNPNPLTHPSFLSLSREGWEGEGGKRGCSQEMRRSSCSHDLASFKREEDRRQPVVSIIRSILCVMACARMTFSKQHVCQRNLPSETSVLIYRRRAKRLGRDTIEVVFLSGIFVSKENELMRVFFSRNLSAKRRNL